MHTSVASEAGSRLLSSFVCTSRPIFHSVAQPRIPFQSQESGGLQYSNPRRSKSTIGSVSSELSSSSWKPIEVSLSSDFPSLAKPTPARGVVTDDIEGIPVGEFGERYLVPNHMEEDVDDGIGKIRLERFANGCRIVLEEARSLAVDENEEGFLRCDLSGCYFSTTEPAVKNFEVIEGEGWRLGYETAPTSESTFCAIVGAGGWSIAMTADEFHDFCTLIQSVRKGIINMDEEGMGGLENIVLQVEKGFIWMQCTLPKARLGTLQLLWKRGVPDNFIESKLKKAFEVRFILSGGEVKRQAEGYWPPEAVFDMLKKIDAATHNQSAASFIDEHLS